MKILLSIVALIPAIGLTFVVKAEPAADPLKAALAKPSATGLLVLQIVEGTQSAKLGVRPGDILTHYHGQATASLAALGAAKQQAAKSAGVIEVVYSRGGVRVVLVYGPGALGIILHPVTKGEAAKTMPPATDVRLDFSSLKDAPRDEWLSMSVGGNASAGFEHHMLRLENGKLHLRREVAFDGGAQWGVNHFDCTVVATAEAMPRTLRTTFVVPLAGSRWSGELADLDDGTQEWRLAHTAKDLDQKSVKPVTAPRIAEYLIESIAAFLPRKEGACLHLRLVSETQGPKDGTVALLVVGEEEFRLDGESVKVWRVQRIEPIPRLPEYGRIAGYFFVDASGRVVHSDYGGAQATLTTKEKALAGLHAAIEVRSAK